MKQAACLLCIPMFLTHEVLVVSRKGDPEMWGMPGGKVDAGETPIQAIIRETKEELGWELTEDELTEVYVGVCDDFIVTTFQTRRFHGNITTEEGVNWKVMPIIQLVDSRFSPFAAYNAYMWVHGNVNVGLVA